MQDWLKKCKKPEIITLAVLVTALAIVLAGLYLIKNHYKIVSNIELQYNEVEYDVQIADIGESYVISGWSLVPGENLGTFDLSVVMWDEKEKQGKVIPAKPVTREDVTEIMNDGCNYDNSGFIAVVRKDRLDNKEYRVVLQYRNNKHDIYVDTDNGIKNGDTNE